MSESFTALSLDDVRASVKRVQTEGHKLVSRLRKDAAALVSRPTKAVQELDAQRQRVRTLLLDRLTGLIDEAVARAGLAKAHDVSDLKRRVHDLERRIERVTRAA